MSRSLADLIAALPRAAVHGAAPQRDIQIEAITSDSRRVAPGSVFVAYPGVAADGHDYIPRAVALGAAAIVAEHPAPGAGDTPLVLVPDAREALAYLAAAWHDYPSRRLAVVGVTGTDGKTTTCNLLHGILAAAGRRVGLITTVNAVIGDRVLDTGLHTTTPDAPDVQRYLAEMVAAGLDTVVLETTSHGLAQHRVAACDYDVAVVTNVTHEHTDIHGSVEAYRRAKMRLFEQLMAGYHKPGVPKVAVLNADDSSYGYLRPIPAERHLAYSARPRRAKGASADVIATGIERGPAETRISLTSPAGEFELRTVLAGDFNVSNILAAATAALALRTPIEAVQAGVWAMKGVVGRMERIDEGQDFTAIIDFAHTPNSLEQALRTAHTLTAGRVIVVFGCAGERDRVKRAWMGEIAGRLADVTVITAEDPRRESLDAIMAEIARGAEQAGAVEGKSYYRVPDRAEAIRFAVDLARPGDLVIACGKAHEQSMCYGTVETPWSEHAAMRAALRRKLSG